MQSNHSSTELVAKGLLAWSREVKGEADPRTPGCPKFVNVVFEAERLAGEAGHKSSQLVDFLFPVLVNSTKVWKPLEEDVIKIFSQKYKPGCYLFLGQKVEAAGRTKALRVSLLGSDQVLTVEPMSCDLYVCVFAANQGDTTLSKCVPIDRIDDPEQVQGYVYPNEPGPSPMEKIRYFPMPSIEHNASSDRSLLSYDQLVLLHRKHQASLAHLAHSIPVDLQACHFLLAKDSYAVVMDYGHRKVSPELEDPLTGMPYTHLMRPGEFLSGVGMVRFANLNHCTASYLNRHVALSRLTALPLVVVQEGMKAFMVNYQPNQGLDLTYMDTTGPTKLIAIDIGQLWADFRLDRTARPWKGHIMLDEELHDVLGNFDEKPLVYSLEMAAKTNLIDLDHGHQLDKNELVASLGQVIYSAKPDDEVEQLEVYWNLYMRVAEEHVGKTSVPPPSGQHFHLYLKTIVCNYLWRRDDKKKLNESSGWNTVLGTFTANERDLSRVGWSRRSFDLYVRSYLWRMYPYQGSIQARLLELTRRLTSVKSNLQRPTLWSQRLASVMSQHPIVA